jgi:hypothetical protein
MNDVAKALKNVTYIIYVAGFIAGIIIGKEFGRPDFNFTIALICWLAVFISGLLLRSIAEILNLLEETLRTLNIIYLDINKLQK